MEESLENLEIDSDKEFQNLLAIRGQLVALLIATSGGTVWLAHIAESFVSWAFALVGFVFVASIIKSLGNVEKNINKIIRRKK